MTNFPQPMDHGAITRVADGVHCVRGTFRMGPGVLIGRTMTLLENEGGIVVLNAIRLNDTGQGQLDALGAVEHLVKLSESHGTDEPYYADRYTPTVWSPPDSNSGDLTPDINLSGEGPISGG